MVTKRFSRTDSTENQSCLQLLRRCTYQVTSRLSSCLTTTLLTCQFSSWQTILLAFSGTSSLWTSLSSQLLQMIYLSSKYQQFATWTDPTEILQWPKDPTVIGTFAVVLFAVITVCSLQIQLALLKPLLNFFTPIFFCSHALQFVYNLEKVLETIRSLSYSIV